MGAMDAFEAGAARGGGADNVPNRLDPNANPLLLFLQSMMPWNNAPLAPDEFAQGGAADEDDADRALAMQLQRQMLEEGDGER